MGKIPGRPRQFGTEVYLLCDAEQVWSCSGPLHYLVRGGGTQQEGLKDKTPTDGVKLVKAAPLFFSRKCGMPVTQFEIF